MLSNCSRHVHRKTTVVVCVLALAAVAAAQSPRGYQPGRRVLLDAHNAYAYQGQWSDRVDRALSTGTPLALEQDLIWRPATPTTAAHSIVSHGEPFTGNEPTLRDFFERIRPLVAQALTGSSRENWPLITLNLDFKDSEPAHFDAIQALLSKYQAWLTTATRTASTDKTEPLHLGPVLVLTGSDPAQQKAFHDAVPVGGPLLLFGAVATAAPAQATNYRRWSNNPWNVVETEGQNGAGEWTAEDADRLGKTVRAAHEAGLWIRFYTLNGHSTERGEHMGWSPGYNFTSLEAAKVRWRAAIDAGVDFIATDQYEEFAQISSR